MALYRELIRELPPEVRTRETVLKAVEMRFPADRRAAVLEMLDRAEPWFDLKASPWLQLAILALAGTSEEQLATYVKAALSDYRDVLAWAYCGFYPEKPTGRVELQKELFAELGIPYPEEVPRAAARRRRRGR